MTHRLFSRQEAEGMLPEIAPLMWQAQRLKRTHDEAQQGVVKLEARRAGNGHDFEAEFGKLQEAMRSAAAEINAIIHRITELGVQVKDLDLGLVDFPSQRQDREVFLCWKLGEEVIGWWHEVNTGYASRQPLE